MTKSKTPNLGLILSDSDKTANPAPDHQANWTAIDTAVKSVQDSISATVSITPSAGTGTVTLAKVGHMCVCHMSITSLSLTNTAYSDVFTLPEGYRPLDVVEVPASKDTYVNASYSGTVKAMSRIATATYIKGSFAYCV